MSKDAETLRGRLRRPALAGRIAGRARTASAIIHDELRDEIVSLARKPGEAISEKGIAARFGVSRTPVREALSLLQLQGLVVIEPQRGSFVFQPTEDIVEELCAFRSMLELGALRLAYARERDTTLRMLATADADMKAAEARGDDHAAAKADAAFHEALFANCGNRFLVQSYALISGQIGAMRYLARHSERSREATPSEHRAIIEAIARSDLSAAVSLLKAHVAAMPARFRKASQARA